MSPSVWTHPPHKPAERASRENPLLELTLACLVSISQVWKEKKIERVSKKGGSVKRLGEERKGSYGGEEGRGWRKGAGETGDRVHTA